MADRDEDLARQIAVDWSAAHAQLAALVDAIAAYGRARYEDGRRAGLQQAISCVDHMAFIGGDVEDWRDDALELLNGALAAAPEADAETAALRPPLPQPQT
jgi:hypothetical protein